MQIETPMDAAMAWADATRSCAEAASRTWLEMTSSAAEFWALPAATMMAAIDPAGSKPQTKSWYRKPVESPLEAMMSMFGMPTTSSTGAAPFGWGHQAASPFGWFGATNWPRPTSAAWTPFGAPAIDFDRFWSLMQLASAAAPIQRVMAEAAAKVVPSNAPPFASFRTDGGHATAHVTMGRALMALVPLLLAMSILMLGMPLPTMLA